MLRLDPKLYEHYYTMLSAFVEKICPITQEALNDIRKQSQLVDVSKGHYMLENGEIEKDVRFLCKGTIKIVDHWQNKSYIYDYRTAPSIVCEMVSFYSKQPSHMSLITITDCHYFIIPQDIFLSLMDSDNSVAHSSARAISLFLGVSHHKQRLFRTLSAEERYLLFLKEFPMVARTEKLSDISSYLGINPATLSRIRNRISL